RCPRIVRSTRFCGSCYWGAPTPKSTPRPAIELPYLAFATRKDALRIAAEIGHRLLDAADRASAVLHQCLDIRQPLARETRQIVGYDAKAGIQRVGNLLERFQCGPGVGHHAIG